MALNDDSVLGCGRTVDDVWADLERPADAHEQTCPHCTAARHALRELHRLTATYRDTERQADTDPDEAMHPSSRVRANVMAIARAEVRRSRQIPVAVTEHGPIRVGEQTLLALVRHAIDSTEGVRARRLHVTTGSTGEVERLVCHLAVTADVVIPDTAATVRDHIVTVLGEHLRADPDAVDLVVEDLYDR
ncbi:hypothetical protein BKD30_03035 [Tersicoccus phoenicis]|uniref:Asp23/Gls24 family envelope stress response protein n=1 Tax=Tersicoccus phoenicis TaxID=554083 RepID=A0A1R1LJJ2_9MICC|nr:hypothetical protein [Tersicoccus phoenicis]OMH27636.1 hypothetical protein BKD30_03035 [Tersicoccus phoenicis]